MMSKPQSNNGARCQISWNNGTELDKEASEKLHSLLKRKLTADDAVQIALLNNRDLQAVYSDLGVAQADLVQAGLLGNPIFDAAVMFPVSGGGQPDLELGAAMNFLNIFYIPLRKRVAAARFEEVKTPVSRLCSRFCRTCADGFLHLSVGSANARVAPNDCSGARCFAGNRASPF